MEEAGEDFIDYNETIVNGWALSMWMYGKGYINEEQIENLACLGIPCVQEVLKDEILFPNTYGNGNLSEIKAYVILAEYMSGLSEFRQNLWGALTDDSPGFCDDSFYKDEDGISLALKINEDDMKEGKIYALDELMEKGNSTTLTLWEQFYSVQPLSIADCDNEDDY